MPGSNDKLAKGVQPLAHAVEFRKNDADVPSRANELIFIRFFFEYAAELGALFEYGRHLRHRISPLTREGRQTLFCLLQPLADAEDHPEKIT